MIRVIIADDHSIVRQGLRQLFGVVPDIHVVAEAEDGPTVLKVAKLHQADLLLLDITMPGTNGIDLISRLHTLHPELPVLVLSMHDDPQFVQRALKSGARGYITKGRDVSALLGAIRKVADGKFYLDPLLAERIALSVSGAAPMPTHSNLTDREYQVLCLLAKGHSVSDIGDQLSISAKTVSTHKARLMEKMGFNSSADLVRYAVANQLSS